MVRSRDARPGSQIAGLALGLLMAHCGGPGGAASNLGGDDTMGGGAGSGAISATGGLGGGLGFVSQPPSATAPDGGALDESCGVSPFGAQSVPVHVLLVVDKSGSMTEVPSAFTSDKWSVVKASLADALIPVQDEVSFGLQLFPYPDSCSMPTDGTVNVDIGPGTERVPTILSVLDGAAPGGGTPTAAALEQALGYFTSGAAAALVGRKYVLLATDGGPTCNGSLSCEPSQCVPNLEGRCPESIANCCDPSEAGPGAERGCLDDAATLAQVSALHAAGIATFVVGIPGSEIFAASLDAFAVAGGVPNTGASTSYFAVEDADSLSAVLRSITSSLVTSCELQLESVPPALDRLNVEVDGELVPQAGDDGWALNTSTNPPTVVLKGETCGRIETEGAESVRVVYGCPTVQIR